MSERKIMTGTYDHDHDMAYITLCRGKHHRTIELPQLGNNVYADVDKDGHILGIEFVSGSEQLTQETLSTFEDITGFTK